MAQDFLNAPDQRPTEPPLWSIGIAVLLILLAPIILYSFAPTGPVRKGDTVFSDGQQRVLLSKPVSLRPSQTDDTCLLDPNSPLIVLQIHTDRTDSSFLAEVQGNPSGEWPFCPVHAEVQLKIHQVFQKPAALGVVRDTLAKWFGR
jgi:hypothetical protein